MPDMIVNGVEAEFQLGNTDGTLQDFTGAILGTDSISHNRTNLPQQIVGGRGLIGVRSTKFESHDFLLSTDANDTTEGVLSCLLYTSPSPRDSRASRMPSSA